MGKNKRLGVFIFSALIIFQWSCVQDTGVNKKRAQAKYDLGSQLAQEGNIQAGLKELLEAAELDPENAEIQFAIGYAYAGLDDPKPATRHFKRAIELKPDFPQAQNTLATLYASQGQWDEAIPLYSKAAANVLFRNRHAAYKNLGSIHFEKGEYTRAIENYEMALKISPRYSPAYDSLGLTYEKLEKWDLAIKSFKKAIDISPYFASPHLHLGKLYIKLARQEEAAKVLLKTIEIDPKGPYGKEAKALLKLVKVPQ